MQMLNKKCIFGGENKKLDLKRKYKLCITLAVDITIVDNSSVSSAGTFT